MNYKITHRSHYAYSESVSLCHNEARLTPRSFFNQTCLESTLHIQPKPVAYREREDFFGNRTTYFALETPHNELEVKSESQVRIVPYTNHQNLSQTSWEDVSSYLRTTTDAHAVDVRQFTYDSPKAAGSPELAQYAKPCFTKSKPLIDAVRDLTARIYAEFDYVPGFTTISTPLTEVLHHKRGVCQDFAHLAIGCLRSLGLAARYISGYLETLPPPGKERLVGADASHAWFSVYVPQNGWIDFDPTNNLMPTDQHITVAWGRDFADATPLKGVIVGSGKHKLTVAVDVERLPDT